MNHLKKIALGVAMLTAGSSQLQAQLVSVSPQCNNQSAMTLFAPDAIACSGAWQGNMNNQEAAVIAQLNGDFGDTFTLQGYSDTPGTFGPFTGNPQTPTGTLTFDTKIFGTFALALKASNAFSFYLFDGGTTGISAIQYTDIGVGLSGGPGNPQNLSHAALYFGSDGGVTTTAVVPEPSTYALMGAGLLALGVAARRKRNA